MIEKQLEEINNTLQDILKVLTPATAGGTPQPTEESEEPKASKKRASKKRASKRATEPEVESVEEATPEYANVKEFTQAAVDLVVSYAPDDKNGQLAKLKEFIASKGYSSGIKEVDPSNYGVFLDGLKAYMEEGNSDEFDL